MPKPTRKNPDWSQAPAQTGADQDLALGRLLVAIICGLVVFSTYCIVANPFQHKAAGCSWTTSTETSVCHH